MNNALLKLAITDKSYPRQVAEILAGQSWSQGCVIQVVAGFRCDELGKRGDPNPPDSVLQQSLELTLFTYFKSYKFFYYKFIFSSNLC